MMPGHWNVPNAIKPQVENTNADEGSSVRKLLYETAVIVAVSAVIALLFIIISRRLATYLSGKSKSPA